MKPHSNVSLEALEPRLAPAGILAVDTNNNLISFDSSTPGTVSTVAITGLSAPATEKIMGIDYRPATGQLYALGINIVPGDNNDQGRIYTINPVTGVATQVGNTAFVSNFATDNDYGFDINPAVDRIRVVTDRDDNLRVNPNDGTLAATDTDLAPTPTVVGVAYTNNFAGATTTTLYGIDSNTNSLVIHNPPNNGTVTTVGPLGVDFGFKSGFDIQARTQVGYASLVVGGTTGLYRIDLTTGAATFVGIIGTGAIALQGLAVALPNDLTIVNNTTATYLDADGDKVTIQITGAPNGAAFSPDDFTFAPPTQFGSQLLLLNLSDDGQEWAKANITINAVPVGSRGDSFANVSFIDATGVDLGKVSVNGDLGRINAGLTGNTIPGLASLTVQSFGVFNTGATPTSAIVGKLGSLTVKADFVNARINVSDMDGSIGGITIGGHLDGRTATSASGIETEASIGNVVINGSIFGGGFTSSGGILASTTMGNVTIGGSIYGGSGGATAGIGSAGTMGNVLIKGSLYGGSGVTSGYVSGNGMGSVTIKGSLVGGTTNVNAGIVASNSHMGAVVIGGDIVGGTSMFSGIITAAGNLKSVTVAGSIRGGPQDFAGAIRATGNMGNVTVTGDIIGGAGGFAGAIFTQGTGNMGNVTIGGSVLGGDIRSSGQLGAVKIAGEVTNANISAVGGTGSPAALLAIKSVSIGLGIEGSSIFGGYNISSLQTNAAATLGPVTVGGDWITSTMRAGGMGAITIKGDLDGRGVAAANGIFSTGVIGNLSIGGNLFGGAFADAGKVDSGTTLGTVTVGGSIFGGSGSYAGVIESGTTMGNVLVKGSIVGGTADHTGMVFSNGNMANVTIKGSIVGATVANGPGDYDSGILLSFANIGTVIIGGNLVGSNSDYSGAVWAEGSIKAVTVNGFLKGSSGLQSASIVSSAGTGNVSILGDMIGGSGNHSGSVYVAGGSLANVTVGGSLIGGQTLTGIISAAQIGAVKITGGMTGGRISAAGVSDPATPALATAIKSVSITGTVQNALILGGFDSTGVGTNPDAAIGAVTVGGNWIASSISAGVAAGGDTSFGTADDAKISEMVADTRFSSIASVTIKGYASGVGGQFGIVSEQVGKVKVGVQTFTFAPGTDTVGLTIGTGGVFRVKEV